MSLITAFILPLLEKELISIEPAAQAFMISEIKILGADIVKWAEAKLQTKSSATIQGGNDG